jgi:hypothetical protein
MISRALTLSVLFVATQATSSFFKDDLLSLFETVVVDTASTINLSTDYPVFTIPDNFEMSFDLKSYNSNSK